MSSPSRSLSWSTRNPRTRWATWKATYATRPDHERDRNADALHAQLMRDIEVGRTRAAEPRRGEHAGQHCADDAAHAVDAEHVQRVVRAQVALQRIHAPEPCRAAARADHHRAADADGAASRRDRNQAGNGPRCRTQHRRATAQQGFDCTPCKHCGRCGEQRVGEGERRDAIGFQRRARVESEPADPEQRCTHVGQRQVVRRQTFAPEADARTEPVGAHQSRDAGVDVHDGAAGEIQRAEPEEEAVVRPHHVREREIGEGEPKRREQQHRRELRALGDRADHQRAADRRERALEGDVGEFGNGDAGRERGDRRRRRDTGEQRLAESPDPRVAAVEGERIAVRDP